MQFQIHRHLCQTTGQDVSNCTLFGNEAVGRILRATMQQGAAPDWQDVFVLLANASAVDATALKDYFSPLAQWLQEQNSQGGGSQCGWPLPSPSPAAAPPVAPTLSTVVEAVIAIAIFIVAVIIGAGLRVAQHRRSKRQVDQRNDALCCWASGTSVRSRIHRDSGMSLSDTGSDDSLDDDDDDTAMLLEARSLPPLPSSTP